MAVFLLILRILLIILGAVILLGLLLLSVRVGVEAVGATGEVSAELRYGIIHIPIYPFPKRKKPSKAKEETPKAEGKPKEKKPSKFDLRQLDIWEALDLLMTILSEMTDTLRFSRLRVRVLIGTDDAAKTGMRLGQVAALTGILIPFFENTFEMKDYHISVDADFDADHTEWAFTVFCSLRPIFLVFVLLRHGAELYRLYKQIRKKEEAITA